MKQAKVYLVLVLVISAVILSACAGHTSAQGQVANTGEHDLSTTRLSDKGLYRVSYESELDPITINSIHSWILTVETPDGEPVENATILIEGGMPDHGHGLPTAPEVTEELGGGKYRVEGLKYSMPGWWTLTFAIEANGEQDLVTFNLVLE